MISIPHLHRTRAAALLGCALVLPGCIVDDAVGGAVVVHESAQGLTAASVLSLNGTYGAGCTDRAGSWSAGVAGGATLANPALSVLLNDTACALSVTSLVADQTYTASPSLAMATGYQVNASPFSAGGTVAFSANAKLSSTSFASDFTMTLLLSEGPVVGSGNVTATQSMKMTWAGYGTDHNGAYDLTSPIQESTANTTWSKPASSCAVRTNGSLWCWGVNANGQVGIGSTVTPQRNPVQVGSVVTWTNVVTSGTHACATRSDNTLWCWGLNSSGELGVNSTTQKTSPVQSATNVSNGWQTIAAGTSHTCGVNGGLLMCWGLNTSGQLGIGSTVSPQLQPVTVGAVSTWSNVAAGAAHACATRSNGTLWCWGLNTNGQLGIGSTASPQTSPVQVGTGTTWDKVATGDAYSCATRTDGTLWCWGLNSSGQLGIGSTTQQTSPVQVGTGTNWSTIAAGATHACATRSTGTLSCWGLNSSGQLGLGNIASPQTSPVQVGTETTWSRVVPRATHTCGTRTDGTLRCWGLGTSGELGVGDWTLSSTAVQVGTDAAWRSVGADTGTTCAIRGDGTLWCWGTNAVGTLGIGSLVDAQAPVQVGTQTTWKDVGVGNGHACATRTTGQVWCWGYNARGQLGTGDTSQQTSPVQVGSNTTWSTLAVGYHHTCATRTDGTLWCWGGNVDGQIGINSTTQQNNPVQVGTGTTWTRVIAGAYHTCGLRTDGTVWCWGYNGSGAVGINSVVTPQKVPVQVGTATNWSSVVGGAETTCALRTDGTLWCWGLNTSGEDGLGNTVSPQKVPVQVGTNTTWNTVVLGASHGCATRADRTLWCWGANTYGQLGLGNTTSPQTSPTRVGTGTVLGVYSGPVSYSTFTIIN